MPNHDESNHRSPRDVPPVGRPRGAVWRSLQADGVVWEGQVLLVGDDADLAARMIVTHRRVAFARGGDLVLEAPRDWLRPEPVLRRDGVLDLFVTMPGGDLFDEPLTIPLRMRDGHPAAGHIIAMLAPGGVRRITPDALSGMERAREAAPPARFDGFWDEPDLDLMGNHNGVTSTLTASKTATAPNDDAESWRLAEPRDHVVRLPSTPPARAQTSAFSITGLMPRDQRRSPWGLFLRVAALTALLAAAAALGAGKLHLTGPGGGPSAILAAPTPTVVIAGSPTPPAVTLAPAVAMAPDDRSALAIGVGSAAQSTGADEGTTDISGTPATESPAVASPAAIAAPTVTVSSSPQATTPESAATATPAPAPTSIPAPATAPAPAAELQPPAVSADEAPAQEIVIGPLRLAFPTALRAESLPRYGLPPGSGEWVLLEADIANEGDAAASLAMNDFRLFDRGAGIVYDLDTGTDVIASLGGFDPAFGAGDVVAVDPGDSAEALLLFLLPPGSSQDLTLIIGQTSLDLAPALALGQAVPAAKPELIEATVVDVLDGAQIAVDIAGTRETVQYLGLRAPAGEACFAADATAANVQLVDGQTVWLEREATERGAEGVLLRDVWLNGTGADRDLVAARLLEAGAALPASNAPDTRYEAWLKASSLLAQSNGAGLWTACPAAE
jgi:endonuclease YncB( thermonuclease family)